MVIRMVVLGTAKITCHSKRKSSLGHKPFPLFVGMTMNGGKKTCEHTKPTCGENRERERERDRGMEENKPIEDRMNGKKNISRVYRMENIKVTTEYETVQVHLVRLVTTEQRTIDHSNRKTYSTAPLIFWLNFCFMLYACFSFRDTWQ